MQNEIIELLEKQHPLPMRRSALGAWFGVSRKIMNKWLREMETYGLVRLTSNHVRLSRGPEQPVHDTARILILLANVGPLRTGDIADGLKMPLKLVYDTLKLWRRVRLVRFRKGRWELTNLVLRTKSKP